MIQLGSEAPSVLAKAPFNRDGPRQNDRRDFEKDDNEMPNRRNQQKYNYGSGLVKCCQGEIHE